MESVTLAVSARCAPVRALGSLCATATPSLAAVADVVLALPVDTQAPIKLLSERALAAVAAQYWTLDRRWQGHANCLNVAFEMMLVPCAA